MSSQCLYCPLCNDETVHVTLRTYSREGNYHVCVRCKYQMPGWVRHFLWLFAVVCGRVNFDNFEG